MEVVEEDWAVAIGVVEAARFNFCGAAVEVTVTVAVAVAQVSIVDKETGRPSNASTHPLLLP